MNSRLVQEVWIKWYVDVLRYITRQFLSTSQIQTGKGETIIVGLESLHGV